jgi:hypothetical protein
MEYFVCNINAVDNPRLLDGNGVPRPRTFVNVGKSALTVMLTSLIKYHVFYIE